MRDLFFDLHGHTVSIGADDADLRSFVRAHFETEARTDTDADLRIRATWRWGRPSRSLLDGIDRARLERLGRGLVIDREPGEGGAPRAIWSRVAGFPELTMAFTLAGDLECRLRVEARCVYEPKGVGRRIEYLRPGR